MWAAEYAGTLFAAIIGAICFAVWSISHIVEWIEPSRVASAYYRYTLTGWLAPALALVLYVLLRGEIEWMQA
ncbi:hypothetical protein [Lewinella sp. 4G2]|uniref:hypothetical protein n=1 Tax=Lewinella sp. 4G2 TaxID=1803372 RepID=UPI0007B4C547|nr:hypothetical protein [Lewinella sp. 4G2]OAV45051.1 hypothetical protein A3850_011380 [Lewinella sp. 4G2]